MSSKENSLFSEAENNNEYFANRFANSDEAAADLGGLIQDDLDIANANVRRQVLMEVPEVCVSVPTDENAG